MLGAPCAGYSSENGGVCSRGCVYIGLLSGYVVCCRASVSEIVLRETRELATGSRRQVVCCVAHVVLFVMADEMGRGLCMMR